MIENAGLMVYIWSIYGNIYTAVWLGVVAVIGALALWGVSYVVTEGEYNIGNILPKKTMIFVMVLSVLLPPKNNLLLIGAATPAAKIIQSSINNGKLKKLDTLTDLALDKALKELK